MTMKADSTEKKLLTNNLNDFWKMVRAFNNCKTSLSGTIEGISAENIELWGEDYATIFNCVKNEAFEVGKGDCEGNIGISSYQVSEYIKRLRNKYSCEPDHITAEHLKNASPRIIPLLAIRFTGFLIHGVMHDSMLAVMLVPVIKNKASKLR